MNNNLKSKIYKMNLILVCSAVLLSSCSNGTNKIEDNKTPAKKIVFEKKETTYKKDNTTEVLLDAPNLKKDDIVKIIKHGDHWHVFTKDGKEHITYTDPNKMSDSGELELVNVVSLGQLKGKNVTSIKIHGNHWHVYTADGQEFLTYENPASIFPNIAIQKYVGTHASNKKHNTNVATASHTVVKNKITESGDEVVEILQHGDHWHIYTKNGNEYVSYVDPRSKYPNAKFGQYVGTHEDHANKKSTNVSVIKDENDFSKIGNNIPKKEVEDDGDEVVTILRHGDHWHIYTKRGMEFISYSDPSGRYPNATVGIYVGEHGDIGGHNKPNTENKKEENHTIVDTIVNNKPNVDIDKSGLVSVINDENTLKKLNVKEIKLHENHYHVYTKDGKEYITYNKGIEKLFPNIEIGKYVGSHGDNNSKVINWPEGVTRIVDHGDHWHLYVGDEEVGVVRENPKSHYPTAEYIEEKPSAHSDIEVNDEDLFSYDDIDEKLNKDLFNRLPDNLRAMTSYGDLETALPIYGSDNENENIFYWLHGNHYHAISLKQIIQNAKAGEYGDYTAKDVVAVLKYKIHHPDEKFDEEIEDYTTASAKLEFIKKYYNITSDSDVFRLGNEVYIYLTSPATKIYLKDLKIVDNEVKPRDNYVLPEIKSNEDSKIDIDENSKEEKKKDENYNITDNDENNSIDIIEDENDSLDTNDDNNVLEEDEKEPEKDKNIIFEENPNSLEEDEKIMADYAKKYNITKDEFESKLFDLPYSPLNKMKFNDDGTVIVNGEKYNFLTGEKIN